MLKGMSMKSFFLKAICVLAANSLVICSPCFSALKCSEFFTDKASEVASNKLLWSLLDAKKYNGPEIIKHLSRDAQLKELFKASAGVWEGYSIKQHTLMVFDVFAEQFTHYQTHYKFRVPSDVRLFQTLKFAIALHDIGKPYSIEAGNKNRQHEFTVPIVEKALAHFGFSVNEAKLAKALIGNDIMSDLVKGEIDAPTAKLKLATVAETVGIPLVDYVPLQFLFYTIDAASYPTLRQRIFMTTEEGLIVPNRSQFQRLWEILGH